MSRSLFAVVALLSTLALAEEGETGVLGLGDPLEVGLVGGTYETLTPPQLPPGTTPAALPPPTPLSATLMGVRLHGGAYTHRTLLGAGGGVEANATIGYALSGTNFWWGQLDALAAIGLVNVGAGPFVFRLHGLVGFGFSLWSGTSLFAGGRLALGLTRAFSLEATWQSHVTVNLTFAHRAQANLVIKPIQVALGAELNFGSASVGQSLFSVIGTATWRPVFK